MKCLKTNFSLRPGSLDCYHRETAQKLTVAFLWQFVLVAQRTACQREVSDGHLVARPEDDSFSTRVGNGNVPVKCDGLYSVVVAFQGVTQSQERSRDPGHRLLTREHRILGHQQLEGLRCLFVSAREQHKMIRLSIALLTCENVQV